MSPLDVSNVRSQFPALRRTVGTEAAVFFDGPAGSQVPQQVIDAIADYLATCNANGGGSFVTSRESDSRIEAAQHAYAAFVGTGDVETVAFGANMTTLVFGLSRALSRQWKSGDEIVVTRLDHDANITPWVLAARDAGATIREVPFLASDMTLDLDAYDSVLSERTVLVAVGAAANSTGTVSPVAEMTRRAHSVGAQVFVDAVHYAPHRLPDIDAWGCDFLAFSPYKFFGPHIGVMWGRRELLTELPSYSVRPVADKIPWRWMTGTTNSEAVCGAKAAIDYIASLSESNDLSLREQLAAAYGNIRLHEEALLERMIDGLMATDGVRVWGITDRDRYDERVATVAITHERHSSSDVAAYLGERGIFVWSGHFYATTVTADLGLDPEGLVRIGLLHYNTAAEVDRLLETLSKMP